MNDFDLRTLVEGKEVGFGLIGAIRKAIPYGVDCELCYREEDWLVSVGTMTLLVSPGAPNVSMLFCLPMEIREEPEIEPLAARILELLGMPPDETYQASLYRFVGHLTTFSSRRSNSRQPSTFL